MSDYINVKKILIFKLCCFGDTVFMTPAMRSLKENFPEAEIYYAHSEWISRMMKHIPYLAGSIQFENVYSRGFYSKIRGTLKFIRIVRKMKFDMVLYGHRSNQLSMILSLCGIRYRLGFTGTKYLTHTAPFRSDLREFDRYQTVLKQNGIKVNSSLPFLKKPDTASSLIEMDLLPGGIILGIFPGGGHNPGTEMSIKQWGFEKYIELIKKLNSVHPNIWIVVFEGKEESERFELPPGLKAIKRTIKNEYLACCGYFISGDTGSLHIAAAFGVSTLSIFGPTDPGLLAPANEAGMPVKHVHIWKRPECSPCYTPQTALDKTNSKYWAGNNFICHKGTVNCMASVTVNDVFEKIEMMLETHNQHH